MSDLITASVSVFNDTPRLSVITVRNFKLWNKLHHPEVLRTLSDDACELFCFTEIHLTSEQKKKENSKIFSD